MNIVGHLQPAAYEHGSPMATNQNLRGFVQLSSQTVACLSLCSQLVGYCCGWLVTFCAVLPGCFVLCCAVLLVFAKAAAEKGVRGSLTKAETFCA